jgi:hypothetical protein
MENSSLVGWRYAVAIFASCSAAVAQQSPPPAAAHPPEPADQTPAASPSVQPTTQAPAANLPAQPPTQTPGTAAYPYGYVAVPVGPTTQCFPICRPGFMCYAGQCWSKCNPLCESGLVCTDDGRCVGPSDEDSPSEPQRRAEEAKARQVRLAARTKPRLTLHGLMSISGMVDSNVTAVGAAVAVGYRQNYAEAFGLHVRLGAGIGSAMAESKDNQGHTTSTDDTAMTELFGELIPYFGPFRRFYFGPMLWYSHFAFDKHTLETWRETYSLADDWKAGVGVDMGLLLLSREQLDINWRVKSTANDQMPFRIEIGVGYHLM